MFTDAQIRRAAQTMIESIAVPSTPFDAIEERIALRAKAAEGAIAYPRFRRVVAGSLALVALPVVAYAVVSYEARSRAALQAHGGWAPPPPPAAFVLKLRPKSVTFAHAQSAAGFSLIAPTGLPAKASLMRIEMGSTGAYDARTHAWRTGPKEVVFRYRRASGRTFEITAQRYDERALPGRYLFEDLGPDAHGNPILIKHERFAWRNGDQMTVAQDGGDIAKAELLAIARSMHGSLLTLPWPSTHSKGALRIILGPQ